LVGSQDGLEVRGDGRKLRVRREAFEHFLEQLTRENLAIRIIGRERRKGIVRAIDEESQAFHERNAEAIHHVGCLAPAFEKKFDFVGVNGDPFAMEADETFPLSQELFDLVWR
jgi:hypothetical protein